MQRPHILVAMAIQAAGHALGYEHVKHLADEFLRRIAAHGPVGDISRLNQQLLRFRHRFLPRSASSLIDRPSLVYSYFPSGNGV